VQHRVIITGAKERLETPQLVKEGCICYLEEFIYFYLFEFEYRTIRTIKRDTNGELG
jgi:hypothetical protein